MLKASAIVGPRPPRYNKTSPAGAPPTGATSMENVPSLELLESSHAFPGVYQIKAIGSAEGDFAGRVLAAAAEELASPMEIDHSIRTTRGGRHVALTMDISVQSADQVRAIYGRLRDLDGLTILF